MKTYMVGMWAVVLSVAAGACRPAEETDECAVDQDCAAGAMCMDGRCLAAEDSEGGGIGLTEDEGPRLDLPAADGEVSSCFDVEQVATHAGCRFWAVDLPNSWRPSQPYSLDIAADQQFAVVVTNVTRAATANVQVFRGRDETPVAAATVEPEEVHTFELPAQNFDPTQNGAARAYRIESDVPIAAYQFQPLTNNVPVYSNDASALFPEHVLGNDYIAVTGDAARINGYPDGPEAVAVNSGAYVTIVGLTAGTHVDIYPTAGLLAPPVQSLGLGQGDAFSIFSDLDNIQGSPTGDLSGTRIVADKPIAVFSGSVSTAVPINSGKCCADHLEHQMMPLWAWGNAYVVAPPPAAPDPDQPAPALYRLTGAFDGTELRYDHGPEGAPATIDAGQTVLFQTDRPFSVRSTDIGKSFALTQFLLSSEAADPTGSGLGDPAMTVIPAAAQMQTSYRFLVPDGYQDNYVTIVAPSSATVELDGEAVTVANSAASVGDVAYRYVNVALDPGPHSVVASDPINITVIGYDEWVSYSYTGGSGILAISDLPPTP